MIKTQLIVALDFDTISEALTLVDELGDNVLWYKVGKQLFTLNGTQIIQELKKRQKKVFLDLKFHDIPTTVSKAVQASLSIGADIVNFHASGGKKMMQEIIKNNQKSNSLLIAVTVLTSLDNDELQAIGYQDNHNQQVIRLAKLAQNAGVHGVVCSAWEIDSLRQNCGEDFQLIVPGIRPTGSSQDDQIRIMTPREASQKGANYIVVGRPITQAKNKLQATKDILTQLQ